MSPRKRSSGRGFESAVGDALRKRIAHNLGIVVGEDRDNAIETTARIKDQEPTEPEDLDGHWGQGYSEGRDDEFPEEAVRS